MSDSPADASFDDHKLPDELEEGAQLAGNSDTGQSSPPFFLPSPVCLVLQRSMRRRVDVCSRFALFSCQASHLHLRNGVAVVPRAARTRRVLRAQPLPRPKLPQRLARRGKGVDLLKYALPNFFPKCSSNLRDCAAQECPGGGCVG